MREEKCAGLEGACKQTRWHRLLLVSDRSSNSIILACTILAVSTFSMTSTIYFPALPYIKEEFKPSVMPLTLSTALFILVSGIAPIFWGAVSDHYRIRRSVIVASLVIYSLSSVTCVLANDIWIIVLMRCCQAVGSSCSLSVGAVVIADTFSLDKRGSAFSKYSFGIFAGPLIGPVIGGALVSAFNSWRSSFWFCFGYGTAVLLFIVCFLPETCKDVDETRQRQQQIDPLSPIYLLRHPFIILASLISSIAFGGMYAVQSILPILYQEVYGLTAWQTGLTFIGAGVGNGLGTLVNSVASDRLFLRSAKKRDNGRSIPEDRLTANMWPCGLFFIPFGLLLFGWSIQRGISVWAPIVGFSVQCFGMYQLSTIPSAYVVDAVPDRGASAAAAVTFCRCTTAAILTVVANPLCDAIDPGWTCTVLVALTVLSMLAALELVLFGDRLRKWSGYES